MAKPQGARPKLTDAERHARFVQTAREVGVDENPGAFDRAFDKVVRPVISKPPSRS